MSTDTSDELPDSAISSWGGFLYQGKTALYHCLKVILSEELLDYHSSNFELQLDSTDDFAIYEYGLALSTHQVKARLSNYRSAYDTALEKASRVIKDCTDNTFRYFHVAQSLDSFDDYINKDGGRVKFYSYGLKKYCPIYEIDNFNKELIKSVLLSANNLISDKLILEKSCRLSEMITRKILTNHGLIHTGRREKEVAYNERIHCDEFKEIIFSKPVYKSDIEYQALETKVKFCNIVEEYINEDNIFNESQIEIMSRTIQFINSLDVPTIHRIHASLQPHTSDKVIGKDDIRNYIDILAELEKSPVLLDMPHYATALQKYIPTSLIIINSTHRYAKFQEELKKEIRENSILASLLYEYNNIIAYQIANEKKINISSDKITNIKNNLTSDNNIVKEFDLRILSIEEARGELNAYKNH